MVASALTAIWLFGHHRAQNPVGLAMRVYTAQVLKRMIVAAACYACFRWVWPLEPAAFAARQTVRAGHHRAPRGEERVRDVLRTHNLR
jgi:hypothetical protein